MVISGQPLKLLSWQCQKSYYQALNAERNKRSLGRGHMNKFFSSVGQYDFQQDSLIN